MPGCLLTQAFSEKACVRFLQKLTGAGTWLPDPPGRLSRKVLERRPLGSYIRVNVFCSGFGPAHRNNFHPQARLHLEADYVASTRCRVVYFGHLHNSYLFRPHGFHR